MKSMAAVLFEMGKPTPYGKTKPLVLEEIEISSPGSGEVLVEIAAAGLCHSDLSVIDGSRPRAIPMVLGHEASGIIREVGQNVDNLRPGDHVVFSFVPSCGHCIPCSLGHAARCENGAKANGAGTLLSGNRYFQDSSGKELNHHLGVSGFSQYTVAAQQSLVKIDSSVPLEKAVLFGCAVTTGAGAVFNTAKVMPGTSVAVFGLGGVGLSAILAARATGVYNIIAVDLIDAKLELAEKAGATHVINACNTDPVEVIKEITSGGAEYTFDCAGNEVAFSQAYSATCSGGTTIAVGLPHFSTKFTIPAVSIVAEERTIKGSYMGSAVPQVDIPRLINLYQKGLLPIDLLMSRTITLDQINEGFDALAKGEVARQVVRFS